MKTCSIEGCTRKYYSKGLCCAHYYKKKEAAEPEKKRERGKRYHAAHLEHDHERCRSHYSSNKEQYRNNHKKWAAANPEKTCAYSAKRRAQKAAAAGFHTSADRIQIMASCNGLCAYCMVRRATDLDHIVPLSRGGSNGIDNLVPACDPCNSSKNNTMPGVWLLGRVSRIIQRAA